MKISSLVKAALALAALYVPSITVAAPGYMADVKMALTFSYHVDGTYEREEDGEFKRDDEGERIPTSFTNYATDGGWTLHSEEVTKMMSFRYGVKELLEDLMMFGYFPEGETSIKGWSVKEAYNGTSYRYFLFKKDTAPVWLDDTFAMDYTGYTAKTNFKTKIQYDRRSSDVKSASAVGAAAAKGMVSMSLGGGALLTANLSGVAKVLVKPKFLPGTDELVELRTLKSTGLGGTGQFFYDTLFAEGSLSTGPAVILEDVEAVFGSFDDE